MSISELKASYRGLLSIWMRNPQDECTHEEIRNAFSSINSSKGDAASSLSRIESMELTNTFKYLSIITDPNLILKHLLILEEYCISNALQSPEILSTLRFVPKSSPQTLQVKIEDGLQSYSAVLREGETFSLGREQCDIYINCHNVLTFVNKAGLVYASKNSAHLKCRSTEIKLGMEFEYLNVRYRVKCITDEKVKISSGGIDREMNYKCNINKKFEQEGKLKLFMIHGGWAIRSNSCEKIKIISGTTNELFFVVCGEEVEFNLKLYRVWYKFL